MRGEERVCAASDLVDGGDGLRFEAERGGERLPAFAVRFGGQVRGFVNRCPHAGTELDWLPGRLFDVSGLYLICATHGALFSPADGACVAGPCAGSALELVPLVEREGGVYRDDGNG